MSLSCSCSEWDGEGTGFYYPEDYTIYNKTRRKRCNSCNQMISHGDTCIEFKRYRGATEFEIDRGIYSDECVIPLASEYFCETCADGYFSLTEIGYCVTPDDEVSELLLEYQENAAMERENKAACKRIANNEYIRSSDMLPPIGVEVYAFNECDIKQIEIWFMRCKFLGGTKWEGRFKQPDYWLPIKNTQT